jgi:hypothetical protein
LELKKKGVWTKIGSEDPDAQKCLDLLIKKRIDKGIVKDKGLDENIDERERG